MGASNRLLWFPRWRVGLVWVLLLAGCHRAASEGPAEHHVPAHKPTDYSAAVAQLGRLHAEIVVGRPRPAGELDVFTEVSDLVRWLPELAAGSDLAEESWNRIAAAADELGALLAQVRAEPAERRAEVCGTQAERWERLLDELTSIAGQS
jgi:hypothetical protein